jgi:hypothetical protein
MVTAGESRKRVEKILKAVLKSFLKRQKENPGNISTGFYFLKKLKTQKIFTKSEN